MTLKALAQGLVFTAIFAAVLSSPQKALAIDNPSSYYDWNSYVSQERVLGLQARAQEETSPSATGTPQPTEESPATEQSAAADTDYKAYKQHDYFFGFVSGWTPSNPLYFIKRAEEAITLTFTFNPEQREENRLQFAGERLHEIETAAQAGKTSTVESLTQDYDNTAGKLAKNLQSLENQGRDVSELSTQVDEEFSRHKLVLEEVALMVPPEAEDGIQTALAASEKAVDTVADVQGKPAMPEEVLQRLQALKAVGILSEEEVTKLVSASSRQQAREEMRKYVRENLIPESDFLKFDQTAARKFPQAFYTNLEVKKFQELKALETEKPDGQTLARVQEFAKEYKPGDMVPPDLRRWWVPMIRLEELQNTIRPDLIPQDIWRNRPEEYQKYQEVVERIKPKKEDVEYINRMIQQNPNLLNDPSYARVKALADKFGSIEGRLSDTGRRPVEYCGTGSHWVNIPYMPQGGYCVPNYDFPAPGDNSEKACPSGYHRPFPGAACYSDNPNENRGGINTASGTCPAGYSWVTGSRGSDGYCAPKTTTDGGGFPSPIYAVGYCLPGQTFVDGKCETYNSPPKEGCASGNWWNGSQCIQQKDCGQASYQDRNGECKQTTSNAGRICPAPAGGCGLNSVWDSVNCNCRSTFDPRTGGPQPTGGYASPNSPSSSQQEAACRAGGGTCTGWTNGACSCQMPGGSSGTSSGASGTSTRCGDGYDWNGSYCYPRGGSSGSNYSGGSYSGSGGSYSGGSSSSGSYSGGNYSGGGYSGSSSGGSYTPPPTGYNPPTPSGSGSSGSYTPPSSEPQPAPAPAPAPAESQPAPTQ